MPAGDRHPFSYPQRQHKRRHKPPDFRAYQNFKSYLRDEFVFTCVYCLTRETWDRNAEFFGVEHHLPKSRYPSSYVDYANLLYVCNRCNRIKGAKSLPSELHPEEHPYHRHLRVERDGTIIAMTPEGNALIALLRLDAPDMNRWRRIHYDIFEEAQRRQQHSIAQQRLRDFFGFPLDMPDFSGKPGANDPYALRANLPAWY